MKIIKNLFITFLVLASICQASMIKVNAKVNLNNKGSALKITRIKGTLNGGVYYYPKVEGIKNTTFEKIQKSFNNQIKNDILSLKNDKNSSLNGIFTINYFNGNIIAFRFVGDSFTPGTVHPNKLDIVFHYDLTSGKLYKLKDLFKTNIDYTKQIKSIAKKNDKAYRAKSSDVYKDWKYGDFDTAWSEEERYFAIKDQNILNVYFFSSYAVGFVSGYDLPLASLKEIINTQGSFYKAITGGKAISVDKLNYTKPIEIKYPLLSYEKSKNETSKNTVISKAVGENAVGFLALDIKDKVVIKNIGEPEKKSKITLGGADGLNHQTWMYVKKGICFYYFFYGKIYSVANNRNE